MIDWITAVIPFTHHEPIQGGTILGVDEDGVLKWKRDKFRELGGSWESTSVARTFYRTAGADDHGQSWSHQFDDEGNLISVTGDDNTGHLFRRELWISGNPAKFLQGHNLFGSNNLPAVAPLFFEAVVKQLGFTVDEFTLARWQAGDYELARVDVAEMLDVGGPHQVQDALSALAHQSTYVKRGRGVVSGGTVSWGKRSARNTVVKCYDKYREITGPKSHQLPDGLPHRGDLHDYAVGKLRAEVEFHARYLDKFGLRSGRNWHADTASIQWEENMSRLNLSGQMPLTPDVLKALPTKLQKTYMQWETGRDLKAWMSYATYKRHRNELLPYGIDIGQVYNEAIKPRTVSLQSVITPRLSSAPAWAHGTPLLMAA